MTTKDSRTARLSDAKRPDPILMLRSDLRAVRSLFAQFQKARSAAEKKAIVQQICLALTVQSQLEEEILYPALMKAFHDKELVPKAREQLATLRALIAEVQGIEPDDDYETNVRMISDYVKNRVAAQTQILPRTRSARIDLGALGAQIASRKQELLAQLSEFGGWD